MHIKAYIHTPYMQKHTCIQKHTLTWVQAWPMSILNAPGPVADRLQAQVQHEPSFPICRKSDMNMCIEYITYEQHQT